MTDDRMTLQTLLEKTSDADLLREMTRVREARFGGRRKVGFAADWLMALEVEAMTPGGSSPEKRPWPERGCPRYRCRADRVRLR